MTHRVPLPDDGTASGYARRALRAELTATAADHAVRDDFIDDAELVTSELVSNAVSHGRPPFELEIEADAKGVRVTVTNHGAHGEPHVEQASETAGRGRGLAIIADLADDWGWTRDEDRIAVWAVVAAR